MISSVMRCLLFFLAITIHALAKSPVIREEFLFKRPPFASCHASTVVETERGDLLCAFFAGDEEGAENVGIWLSRRIQDVWQAPQLIAVDPKGQPCWNPVLYAFPGREILLFYKVGPNPQRWSGVMKRSFDGGETWGKEEPLPAGIYGPIKNKPLLNQETLICGSSVESYDRWGCYCETTNDMGKTWSRSNPINLPNEYFGMIQPSIVQLPNKQLLMVTRTRKSGYIGQATSADEGKTWSNVELTSLPNPNSAVDAVCLQDGRVLLVYNHSSTSRTPLNIALSDDNGRSWKNVFTFEDTEGEFSYPAVIQTKEGLIVITYTWNRTHIKEVVIDAKDLQIH